MKTWRTLFVRTKTKAVNMALSLIVASSAFSGAALPVFVPPAVSADPVCEPIQSMPGLTTGSPPAISFVSPAGIEAWGPGTMHDITWIACNTGTVDIEYGYTGNDSQWHTVASIGSDVPSDNGDTSFLWDIPANIPPTPAAQIRIGQHSGTVSATTDDFTIGDAGPVITTNIPSGHYIIPRSVSFFADDGIGAYVSLDMHYTDDGTNPTLSSPPYTGPILVKSSEAIKLLATDSLGNSTIATFTYVINPLAVPQPTMTIGGTGTVGTAHTTLQWREDVSSGPDTLYQIQLLRNSQDFTATNPAPITVNGWDYTTEDLADGTWFWRVRACDTGCTRLSEWSNVNWFIIDTQSPAVPAVDIGSGTYNTPLRVTFHDTSLDVIRISLTVTVNGKRRYQTCNYNSVTGCTFSVSASETVKATAADQAGHNSVPVTYTYVIDTSRPGTPVATLSPGTYADPQTITLSAADNAGGTGLAGIYYTTDGSTPDKINGTIYTDAILINSSKVIKAVAYDKAGNVSRVATFAYDIPAPLVPAADASGCAASSCGPADLAISASVTDFRYFGYVNSTANAAVTPRFSAAGTTAPISGVKGAKTNKPDRPKPTAISSRALFDSGWWWLAGLAVAIAMYLAYRYRRGNEK